MKYISRKDYLLRLLKNVNYYKTARINFHYFPFKVAIKFPIILFGKVDIDDCLHTHIDKRAVNQQRDQHVVLNKIQTGIFRFGIAESVVNGFYCTRKSRLAIKGKLILGDSPIIVSNGCNLVVEKTGELSMGGGNLCK